MIDTFEYELGLLISIFPVKIQRFLKSHNLDTLIEIIIDVNRPVELRFTTHSIKSDFLVDLLDIDYCLKSNLLGEFNFKNRAGILHTLHRISGIFSLTDDLIGLTCRIGRSVPSSIDLFEDMVNKEGSLLLLSPPGKGKTTSLREIANRLSNKKRVMIVDTSCEIAGDNGCPHDSVGSSRRLVVPKTKKLADVMLEACENHYPEVIITDEISSYQDVLAARTIAERGIRLIASAHGSTLSNLMRNEPLNDLVGRLRSQTMSDSHYKKEGSKNKLEREHHATFEYLVELRDFDLVAIHYNIEESVDNLVNGYSVYPEIRTKDSKNKTIVLQEYAIKSEED